MSKACLTLQEVNNGIDVINGARNAFGEIQDAIRVVSNQIDEVAVAVDELATGAEDELHLEADPDFCFDNME